MIKTYTVKLTFKLADFLAACRAINIKLSAETAGEQLDGFIELAPTVLTVHVNNPALIPDIDIKVAEYDT